MSLIERAEYLTTQIQSLDGLKKRADQADTYEKRAKDLTIPLSALVKLQPTLDVFLANDISCESLNQEYVSAIRGRVIDLRDRYANDKSAILNPFPDEDVRYVFNQPLAQLPLVVSTALKDTWAFWAKKHIPTIDNDVLDILAGIASLKNSVNKVRALQKNVYEICEKLPEDVGIVLGLETMCNEIASTWQDLAGDGIPDDVMNFLRAAGNRDGAKIEELTLEVLNWLNQHGLQNSLRIRMG